MPRTIGLVNVIKWFPAMSSSFVKLSRRTPTVTMK